MKERRKRKRLKRRSNILGLLDPLQGPGGPYNLKKDTSHLILLALSRRGHTIFLSDPSSLFVSDQVRVRTQQVTVLASEAYFFFQGKEETRPLSDFPVILMRKDPPVDERYLYATQLLSLVTEKLCVINAPQALRDFNEKLAILHFPRWIPRTLVTADRREIDRFIEGLGSEAIVKPLEGFAGLGVHRIDRTQEDYITILSEMTREGSRPVMVQKFLPEVFRGEKRVFFLEGKPFGTLLKIPPEGQFITNPDTGAHLAQTRLTLPEKKLCLEVGRFLKRNGIFFAGIDVIDEKLTEINITSPGLLWELNEVDNFRYEEMIASAIEKRLKG